MQPSLFAHLIDGAGHLVAQFNGLRQNGRFPTAAWLPSETDPEAIELRRPADRTPDRST